MTADLSEVHEAMAEARRELEECRDKALKITMQLGEAQEAWLEWENEGFGSAADLEQAWEDVGRILHPNYITFVGDPNNP